MHRRVVNRCHASMRLAAGVQAHPGARRACPNGRWRLQARLGHLIGALLLTLSGCAITTEPVPPCCYRGDYAMARLGEVKLVLSAADEGGLVRWVRDTKPAMQAETRRLFEDLERIGVDLRTRGSEGDPDGAGGEGGFGR